MNYEFLTQENYKFFKKKNLKGFIKKQYERYFWERLLPSIEKTPSHTKRGVPNIVKFEDETFVVRQYFRGGIIGLFLKDLYLGDKRAFKELFISTQVKRCGIPIPEIISCFSIRQRFGLYRCYLISKMVQNSINLSEYILSSEAQSPSLEFDKKKLLGQLANILYLMHQKGIYHADLNIKNILISLNQKSIYIIDWDKSFLKNTLSKKEKVANITRLIRSMEKFRQKGYPVKQEDKSYLIKCYLEKDDSIRKDLFDSIKRMEKSLKLRKVIWRLKREL